MIGQTLSHYTIEARLGAGGMGEVYLARDLALGRPAALKVVGNTLEPALRERLLREATAGARLQHPAIATFYEAGEADAGMFIAMEYVRGETLRHHLKGGPMPLDAALGIARALLEALHHAHGAGILHRDIKPENIMLTAGGTPKLLDFGLARLRGSDLDDATLTNLTQGAVLGTIGYMSPEQLRGEPVDERSDIFALGAVLFEMVTGQAAFPGQHPAERITAILAHDPMTEGTTLDADLRRVLTRALSKPLDARYATASEMLSDLRSLAAGEQAMPLPHSLAVVDLHNLSGQTENDWVGSGIAESVTIDLARLPGLIVVPRDRVLRTARQCASGDARVDPHDIGRRLGCRWVLSGTFQRTGSAVRITTTLAEVATGSLMAAEKLDGSMDGIFDLQDRLSQAVVASLSLRLPAESAPAGRDLQAFELHARGRRLWQRLEKGTFDQAGELYRRAIDIDPGHAPSLAGLAALHAMRFTFTTDPAELDRAAEYARRAIAAAPTLAEPHIWLGYALMRRGQMDDALASELRAADLDPGSAFAPYFAGAIEAFRGRPAQALPYFQRAVTLDPLNGYAWLGLGSTHLSLDDVDQAIWSVGRAVALEDRPEPAYTSGARVQLADCLRARGDLAEARRTCMAGLEAVERSDHMYRDSVRGLGLLVLARIALDQQDPAAATAALHQLIAHVSGRQRTLGGGYLMVQAMAGLARAGAGAHWLQDARALYARRDRFDFSLTWSCADDVAEIEMARAAAALETDSRQAHT